MHFRCQIQKEDTENAAHSFTGEIRVNGEIKVVVEEFWVKKVVIAIV